MPPTIVSVKSAAWRERRRSPVMRPLDVAAAVAVIDEPLGPRTIGGGLITIGGGLITIVQLLGPRATAAKASSS